MRSISERRHHRTRFIGHLLLLTLFLPSCAQPPSTLNLKSVFPPMSTVHGWSISQKVRTYTHDTLFNMVDGQADSFFAYGFQAAAVQRYQDSSGTLLNVEIWQLETSADAYGLFTAARSGSAAAIGNEGDTDPGQRLAFWQDRYFVSLGTTQPVPDATLLAFAQAISAALPAGGEVPDIVKHLPSSELVERSCIFFHEEISIRGVWLGGENLLGLSQATDGVVASYQDSSASGHLLLVEYHDSAQANKALKALQGGNLSGLVASATSDRLLGAVFGNLDITFAQSLLQSALK